MKKQPIFESIIDYIKEQIAKGCYDNNQQIPTEKVLMEMFSTSRPTVARAMGTLLAKGVIYRVQGRGTFVSPDYVEENMHKQTNIVTMLFPFLEYRNSNRFDELNLIKGMESIFTHYGYHAMIRYCQNNAEDFFNTVQNIKTSLNCDGMVLYPAEGIRDVAEVYDVFLDSIPTVLIDKALLGINLPIVQSDNLKGGYLACKHLLECGYDEVYFLTNVDIYDINSARDRYLGFCNAIREIKGINKFNRVFTYELDKELSPELIKNIAREIYYKNQGKRVGIFCVCDDIAMMLHFACTELGIVVPEQFGIVGFGGSSSYNPLNVRLSTVNEDFFAVGQSAAKLLISRINHSLPESDNQYIYVEFLQGDTTKK